MNSQTKWNFLSLSLLKPLNSLRNLQKLSHVQLHLYSLPMQFTVKIILPSLYFSLSLIFMCSVFSPVACFPPSRQQVEAFYSWSLFMRHSFQLHNLCLRRLFSEKLLWRRVAWTVKDQRSRKWRKLNSLARIATIKNDKLCHESFIF